MIIPLRTLFLATDLCGAYLRVSIVLQYRRAPSFLAFVLRRRWFRGFFFFILIVVVRVVIGAFVVDFKCLEGLLQSQKLLHLIVGKRRYLLVGRPEIRKTCLLVLIRTVDKYT